MSSASTARHAWARDEWKPLGKNQTRVGKKTEKIEARPRRVVSGRRDGLGYGIDYSIHRIEISPGPASPPSPSRLARESDWIFSLAIFLTRWFSAVAGFLPRTRARPDQFWISPSRAGFPDRQLQKLASILSVTRARPDDCHPLIWMLKTCVTARELTRQSA